MRKGFFLAGILAAAAFSSCATGGRGHYRGGSDRMENRQSSYRIKGEDELVVLSPKAHAKLRAATRSWRWPLKEVAVTSQFGLRGGDFHDGIDLRAPSGTPVYSVAPGTVIYAGSRIRGYGKMIVIKHPGNLTSVYAHNSKLIVKQGARVRRGQRIASSGNTGHSTGPHVHFEIREGVKAINPLSLLVKPAVVREANRRIAASRAQRGKRVTSR